LVTFTHDGNTRIGVLDGQAGEETVVDLRRIDPSLPTAMIAFLKDGGLQQAELRSAIASAGPEARLDATAVKIEAPIPEPGKTICVGLNYRDHVHELGLDIPEIPTIFAKFPNTVIGPHDPICVPPVTKEVDWEGELAFVIGRRARNVSETEANAFIAGYTCLNDVSARDFQMRTSQWLMGKTFDTFAPMGPALVTADEIADPHDLDIRTLLNGEVVQASNTSNLIFSVPYLVAYLSRVMTLEPGDVISTGTPSGIGMTRQPQRFLQAGDVVRVQIENIGELANRVEAMTEE
jgi:acylpyruvate hydrolase